MSNIKQIKIGNTPYDLKDETARLGKLDNSNVSTVQTTLTASKAFAINDPFMYEGQLYKADSAIAQGGTIVINGTGQNASPTTIEALINLHSGGGSGGHTILNSSGTAMTARGKLQFDGATVTDDSANDKTIVTPTDTKNTAGSTDSSSKLFLIGATSQAANPQTYSQDTAYVGTDGNLYSGSKVVATQNMIGDAWVLGHAYALGDYAIDANGLYKTSTAHTSTATNRPSVNQSRYWTLAPVASQLGGGGNNVGSRTLCTNCIIYRVGKMRMMSFSGATVSDYLNALKSMSSSDLDRPSGRFNGSKLSAQLSNQEWDAAAYIYEDPGNFYCNIVYYPTRGSSVNKAGTLYANVISYDDNIVSGLSIYGQFIYTV